MWLKYFPVIVAESSNYTSIQNLDVKPYLLTLSMPSWVSQQCVKILQKYLHEYSKLPYLSHCGPVINGLQTSTNLLSTL